MNGSREVFMPSTHVREHRSVLAAVEKRVLVWLAARMPRCVNSDHLTLLGLASMIAAGAAFAGVRLTPWSVAGVVAALAANWFGDSLDGTLARVRNQQRPRYGFYVDHVIDLAGTAFLLAGLACSGSMNPLIALTLLAAYLLVAAESFLATHAVGVFRISCFGFGPTELRIILAIGAVQMIRQPWVSIAGLPPMRLFDVGGIVAIAGLAIVFIVSAVRNTCALYLAEPLPALSQTCGVRPSTELGANLQADEGRLTPAATG
jgi:phosphatidylglycerophosphate synthase